MIELTLESGFFMRAVLLASSFLCAALVTLAPFSTPAFAAQAQGSETAESGNDSVASPMPGAEPQAPGAVTVPAITAPDGAATPAISIDEAQRRQALQKLISERVARLTDRKDEQTAVDAFYKERDFQPLWIADGAPTAQAQAAIDHLKYVAREGLDPADYPRPELPPFLNPEDAAAAELKLTLSLLTYARHASSGRVSYTRVSAAILYPPGTIGPAQVLSQLAASKDVTATLDGFEPPQPGYKALKAQLAKAMTTPGAPKRGAKMSNADLIVANMERWRWLPRDLGASYVMVNIPQYALQLMDRGKPLWATKIVVGKPGDMATPLLSETMKYLTVNPTWNVPPSIIRNEYLPALERDSGALERIGLKVGRNHDGSVRVYQPPGPKNALGRIRFNFPNPFLVYQHDTPNKNLFAQDKRALSHGCMRVQNPDKYAEALLSVSQPKEGMTAARIRDLYGDAERTINLHRPIPVHITYQTASVDEAGNLVTRDDIYGLDAAIIKLMHGRERAVADKAIPRKYESSSKPVMARLPRSFAEGNNEPRRSRSFGEEEPHQRTFAQPYPAAFFDRAMWAW
ncbi:MAG TPA: L,D-transpeptidase family protein [Pseudolabrys sp.]|nr:L,D-transpeptidase family protein [Pseudolabrys sp.]